MRGQVHWRVLETLLFVGAISCEVQERRLIYVNDEPGGSNQLSLAGTDTSLPLATLSCPEGRKRQVKTDGKLFMEWCEDPHAFPSPMRDGPYREIYVGTLLPFRVTSYKDGKLHGKEVTYHKNGASHRIHHYENGLLDGGFSETDENGELKVTGWFFRKALEHVSFCDRTSGDCEWIQIQGNLLTGLISEGSRIFTKSGTAYFYRGRVDFNCGYSTSGHEEPFSTIVRDQDTAIIESSKDPDIKEKYFQHPETRPNQIPWGNIEPIKVWAKNICAKQINIDEISSVDHDWFKYFKVKPAY